MASPPSSSSSPLTPPQQVCAVLLGREKGPLFSCHCACVLLLCLVLGALPRHLHSGCGRVPEALRGYLSGQYVRDWADQFQPSAALYQLRFALHNNTW